MEEIVKETAELPEEEQRTEPEEKTKPIQMTQEEFDNAIKARLKRDRETREREAEELRLKEQQEYEKLYETSKAELDALKSELAKERLDREKTALVVAAGYPADKVEFVKGILTGDDVESLKVSLETVLENMPPVPTYVDPNPANGRGSKPAPQSNSDYGRELAKRITKK